MACIDLKKRRELLAKPIEELKEMLERQDKMIQNKNFISKLKDKGKKILEFRANVEKVLIEKKSIESTSSLLSRLNLGEKIIMPKHPLYTPGDHNDVLNAKKLNPFYEVKDANTNVVQKLISEEIDIYSFAISKTFDEDLATRRSERFVPNRLMKPKGDKINDQNENKPSCVKTEKIDEKDSDIKVDLKKNLKVQNVLEKYKGSALEHQKEIKKFQLLSMDESLEVGKNQKFRDFEIERKKFIRRLGWRTMDQFDSEDSDNESQNTDSASEYSDEEK